MLCTKMYMFIPPGLILHGGIESDFFQTPLVNAFVPLKRPRSTNLQFPHREENALVPLPLKNLKHTGYVYIVGGLTVYCACPSIHYITVI